MKKYNPLKRVLSILLILLTGPFPSLALSSSLLFNTEPILEELPNKEVQSIYQDREGYLWISTRNGLFLYDGYDLTTYKSNMFTPNFLSANNVHCTVEDGSHHLWIGTNSGLDRLDKRTGEIQRYEQDKIQTWGVSCLLVTSDNRVLIGSERGLYEYIEADDRFRLIDGNVSNNVFRGGTIKSLLEDHRGDIWIGTWSSGLYRWEKETGQFYSYPRMNPGNSAHVLFQDSQQRIWVGTWGSGLQLLHHAYDPQKTTWTTFKHAVNQPNSLSDNLVYDISEDLQTNTLWVGTRNALSILSLDDVQEDTGFQHYYASNEYGSIGGSEVSTVLRDRQGLMWVGMIGGGVNKVNTRKSDFSFHSLSDVQQELNSSSVRRVLQAKDGKLWLSISTYGFGWLDRNSEKFTHFTQLPDFAPFQGISTVMSFMESPSTGHIWIGVYDGGLYEYNPSAPVGKRVVYWSGQEPWMCGPCVYCTKEDKNQNLWIATRTGISIRTRDNKAVRIDSLQVNGKYLHDMIFLQLCESLDGKMWAASEEDGVLCIEGSGADLNNYKVTSYSTANGKLNHNHVTSVFCNSNGSIFVGTGGGGLNLYDVVQDKFLPVHLDWNLPGDAVNGILEDRSHNLWLLTNVGLLKLSVSGDAGQASYRLYTTSDGLRDNVFNMGSVFATSTGEMLIGGHHGVCCFYPERLKESSFTSLPVITDIKVFNHSWKTLPRDEREAISTCYPSFTNHIELDYKHNNFSIEFSALEFQNPQRNLYAYKLNGFDSNWQYTDGNKRFAYYNNLQPGDYTFYLRSSNSNGIWHNETRTMHVTVLPPPWLTWWAYLLYFCLFAAGVWYAFRVARNRMRLQNALHLREVEKEKAEELNHTKLQFFTNITHELLTPLTILSASVDALKQMAPAYGEQYRVMTNNINRLIRLLQQILEFRKAESGNLKLRVSLGDLVPFIHHGLDSFRPLMQRKDIHLSFICQSPALVGWFDADKLDKILYNLLSNAAKYSYAGETVQVELSDIGEGRVQLTVRDNGPGISQEDQKDLFKRFYEGSYRKFNTIGTGIGLSLIHDLVLLHHGTISLDSELGKGTAFIIQFPICQSAYPQEEIDEQIETPQEEIIKSLPEENVQDAVECVATQPLMNPSPNESAEFNKLLLVEDNEELLQLMVKLLRTEFQVYQATNGQEAVDILAKQEIHLIVSDVMMPVMDGIALCKHVKTHIETSHIPLILLTAKNNEEDRVEAYESGADAFISKPFSLSVLHARINNLLRTRQEKRQDFKNQLVFETKELDYTSLDEEFLKQAVDCVNRHLDDSDFDLTQFLEEMHTTKSTCFRKLKSLTGLTFVSFLRNIRIKAACRIMEEKKHIRISELAYAVGFNDPRYFSSTFKKEMGMQPSEYMERFTQGGVIED